VGPGVIPGAWRPYAVLLETAQILTNRTEEAEVIVTLAQNGGLQIQSRL
jgi:predicted sugar kinase